MPKLDGKGPEKNGPNDGRKLGKCAHAGNSDYSYGQGMGKRRNAQNNETNNKIYIK